MGRKRTTLKMERLCEFLYKHPSETLQVWFQTTATKRISNKVNTAIKRVAIFFGFPVHIRVTFPLYCSLISVR